MANKLIFIASFVAASTALMSTGVSAADSTLAKVTKQGFLTCGVSTGLPGFSNPNSKGEWEGIDVEYCQALAAAIFGDKTKVKYVPLTAKERFTALQSGEIDVLSRNTTWTLHRDTALGLNFVGVSYYDGQGFMVKKELGLKSAKELNGASVCVQSGTTTELNLADYFRNSGMSYKPVVFDTAAQTSKGFDAGRCDVLTTDQSGLYALRLNLQDPASAVVLPEIISKEPLGPVVRQGDDQWFNIGKWTLAAMVNAEEYGITSKNAEAMLKSKDPNVKRILGVEGPKGKGLGIRDDWGYQILKQVGNYGESFERTVGSGSPLQISRGVNALWNDGGFMYAPPIR
ncbi:amino acid ABC transporter substrate-binding protein [Vibrio pectenicida]|uniref:Amino acid ABC transporter substrate-binding protein n=1 Tax=Vibrio pectenicida TaxID=62763 RepID=A0A3R9FJN4_9VIBR|nr:amino acid ABC transporter substrate-binding protein [Vibrio pectenicida]NOH70049.1 amino acid ABC transporter substrate-binding protein [Vibrio pectenicida]RSD27937.1 amino acid ABC transporter substrate-binding protein [Vibrio pectenicida]